MPTVEARLPYAVELENTKSGRTAARHVSALAVLADNQADPGVLKGTSGKVDLVIANIIAALGKHRHPEREAGASAS